MNTEEDRIRIIKYYPDINYIPNELNYLNILVDRNVYRERQILSMSSGSYWEISIKDKYINKELLTDIRKLDINNAILPNNAIYCIYNDKNLKKK